MANEVKKVSGGIKKILLISGFAFALNLVVVGTILADQADTIIDGLSETGQTSGFAQGDATGQPAVDFPTAFSNYATGLAGILSGLFLILVIYGGWLWMTARGNEEQVNKSKKIIIGAVIGIAIIVAARIIVELVFVGLERGFLAILIGSNL